MGAIGDNGEYSFNAVGEILYVLQKNDRKFLNDSLGKYGFTLLQAMCLLMIDYESKVTQQELTEIYFLSKSAVTKSINNLEDQGFIYRKASQEDKRQYELVITESGEEMLIVIKDIFDQWETALGFNELDDDFIEKLAGLAQKAIKLNENNI